MMRRSASIIPLSGAKRVSSSKCPHFFRCLDTDGVFRDSASGVIVNPGQALSTGGSLAFSYDSTLKAISSNMTFTTAPVLTSGAPWHTFGSGKSVLIVWAGRVVSPNDVRLALGDINGTLGGPGYGVGLPLYSMHAAIGKNGGPISRYIDSGLAVTVANGGGGYTSNVTATHVPGTNGVGAEFVVDVSSGVITALRPINSGYDFILGGDPVKNGSISLSEVGAPAASLTLAGGFGTCISSYHTGRDIMAIFKYTPGQPLYYRYFDMSNLKEYGRVTAQSGWTTDDVGSFTPDTCMKLSGVKSYGAALYEVSPIPADWWVAAVTMAASWKNGERYLFPGTDWT